MPIEDYAVTEEELKEFCKKYGYVYDYQLSPDKLERLKELLNLMCKNTTPDGV